MENSLNITQKEIIQRLITAQQYLIDRCKSKEVDVQKLYKKEEKIFKDICEEIEVRANLGIRFNEDYELPERLKQKYDTASKNFKTVQDVILFTKDLNKKKISYKDIDISEKNINEIYTKMTGVYSKYDEIQEQM